jgi:hypothetical protein
MLYSSKAGLRDIFKNKYRNSSVPLKPIQNTSSQLRNMKIVVSTGIGGKIWL